MKFFDQLDEKYEIYQRKDESWYRAINWYIVAVAFGICIFNGYIMMNIMPAPFIGVMNLMLIMPLSPLATLHVRKRNVDNGTNS